MSKVTQAIQDQRVIQEQQAFLELMDPMEPLENWVLLEPQDQQARKDRPDQ